MIEAADRAGLKVDPSLARFIEERVLPGTGIGARAFWRALADIYVRFVPENRALLAKRDDLQRRIDSWHENNASAPIDLDAYQSFLHQIGYLKSEPQAFTISTKDVDDEIARVAGPQLVVPILNARFALNATNARWGSLYDALYGTDALSSAPASASYDPERGARVIAKAKAFLDQSVPIRGSSWADITGVRVAIGSQVSAASAKSHELFLGNGPGYQLVDGSAFVGFTGEPDAPTSILLRHHGLHIELVINRHHAIGATDPIGLADIMLEAALTTIVDLEDSIAAVDADDKVAAYANWLGLMKGDLQAVVEKDGRRFVRELASDREFKSPDGGMLTLPGRSLLLVRNVGHLMTTPAIRLADGAYAPEGILDGVVTSLIAMHDLRRNGRFVNSKTGSIYIVKPKMHGPQEVEFTARLFDSIEDALGLARHTIKIGVMDEERRTSANLAACIAAVRDRIIFINTGFLDRTGDEIHTSMRAGPMVPKVQMKSTTWIRAYEDRNVQIALACGLAGRAQIGKGMWAAPDRMADMLEQKIAHPQSGASTAWVPSPTAATLHATHYHAVDVFARQNQRKSEPIAKLGDLLRLPLAGERNWSAKDVSDELDNNVQGILGYVVRWVDQGIGCSKVPDIHDIGLMEDRATLRISSQHVANWLLHGVCSEDEVKASFRRMAAKVDAQNQDDPNYRPMSGTEENSLAFQAALALVFKGRSQPNGYTEPLLHSFRARAKSLRESSQSV